MKTKYNQIINVLRNDLNGGDISYMLRRTLIAVAVGIWVACALAVLIAWGLKGN